MSNQEECPPRHPGKVTQKLQVPASFSRFRSPTRDLQSLKKPDSIPRCRQNSELPMLYDVFISHSKEDRLAALAICARFEAEKLRCWIAPRDIPSGADWAESIINALNASRVMVLVFSARSNDSPQVKREVHHA